VADVLNPPAAQFLVHVVSSLLFLQVISLMFASLIPSFVEKPEQDSQFS
jgi:hypothetical protein